MRWLGFMCVLAVLAGGVVISLNVEADDEIGEAYFAAISAVIPIILLSLVTASHRASRNIAGIDKRRRELEREAERTREGMAELDALTRKALAVNADPSTLAALNDLRTRLGNPTPADRAFLETLDAALGDLKQEGERLRRTHLGNVLVMAGVAIWGEWNALAALAYGPMDGEALFNTAYPAYGLIVLLLYMELTFSHPAD